MVVAAFVYSNHVVVAGCWCWQAWNWCEADCGWQVMTAMTQQQAHKGPYESAKAGRDEGAGIDDQGFICTQLLTRAQPPSLVI